MQEELVAKDPLAYSYLAMDGFWKSDSISDIITPGSLLSAIGP